MAVPQRSPSRSRPTPEGRLMASSLPWGEEIEILAELGFLVREFTLNSSTLNGSDVLDGTLEGLDIAPYVQEARISRGRQDQLASFSAGSLSLKLLNNDRRFDPLNQDSPYWDAAAGRSGVVPRRKVSISADGEPLFVGRIIDVDVQYDPAPSGKDRSTAVLTCADDFQILANTATEAAVTPSAQLSGARVSYLLDLPEIGYPATRDIDTGVASLGSYQIAENTNALTYLQRIAEAEQGLCFIARGGDLTFLDRSATSFSNPVESFSDSGIGIPYQTLSIRYGSEILFNKVVVTPEGATPQTADDAASQTEFGIQTLTLSDSLLGSEAQALSLAEDLIGQFSEPEYRFDAMSLILNDKSEADRVAILGLEIGDQISITRTFASGSPLQVSDTYQIQSISHQITPGAHTVGIGLAWISIVYQFLLNDPEFGVLDADNALA